MRKTIFIISSILILVACDNHTKNIESDQEEFSEEVLRASIQEMDDSLMAMMREANEAKEYTINRAAYYEAINRNKDFYFNFPEAPFSETALNNIAALYLQLNVESEAAKWRDTLLTRFPNTEHKIGLLELQMNYYDFNEYTPEKIKFYATELLAIDDLPEEKREQYEFRLEHLDKTFEELIDFQLTETDIQVETIK